MNLRPRLVFATVACVALFSAGCRGRRDSQAAQQEVLPKPDAPFAGVVDQDPGKARAAFPAETTATKGAPNVVLILVDDVGFSATATFGGAIHTPNFDRLAAARSEERRVGKECQ